MKLKICLMGLLCLFFRVNAQKYRSNSGLNVGDKLPDLMLSNIINYPGNTLKLTDLKDKVIVLDFWATWCSSCINAFPANFALQKKYAGHLQVLLVDCKVTRDKESDIRKFLDRRSSQYQFPCVIADTILNVLFPHQTLPHCVVIKNNTVLAITGSEGITEKNIAAFINSRNTSLAVKADRKYDSRYPLFVNGNGGEPKPFLFRSILLGRVDNLSSRMGFNVTDKGLICSVFISNNDLVSIFRLAYPEFSKFGAIRTISKVAHSSNSLLDSAAQIGLQNAQFTYEASFPPRSRQASLQILKDDLERYFNLRLDSQDHDTDCYVLEMGNIAAIPKIADNTISETNLYERSGAQVYYTNRSLTELVKALEGMYKIPFLNETSYAENVSLQLPADPLNANELKSALEKQGFALRKEKRRIRYLVLSEKKRPL